jgi:hypothetical protein
MYVIVFKNINQTKNGYKNSACNIGAGTSKMTFKQANN